MAQRDAGGIPTGSIYVNPVNDPVPAGFTGQGTPTIPAETGPPPGFAGNVRLASVPGQTGNPALPKPPPGYVPGPLAPARHAYQDSMLFKIGSVLASYGESVPVNLKIKLAQQKADMELDQHKMGWDNYYKSVELARSTMEHQNAQAAQQFIGMLPNIGAQLATVMSKNTPPDQRAGLVNTWKGIAETLYPGGGNFVDFMSKNLHNVFATNVFLNDPKWGPQFQDLAARVGIDQMYQNPEFMKLTDHAAFDWANTLSASDTVETNTRLGKKDHGVTEDEFRKIVTRGAANQQVHPQMLQAVLSYLDSVKGQEYMSSRGIETGSASLAQDKKRKEAGPIEQAKIADFEKKSATIADAKANPGKYTPAYITGLQNDIDTYTGLRQKESAPSESPNSMFNRELLEATNGKHRMASDLDKMVPGSSEYNALLNAITVANNKVATNSAQAQLSKQMGTPVDMSKTDMYSRKDIRAGKVSKLSVPMSEAQKRTNPDMIELDPKIVASLTKLKIAKEQGNTEMYDLAAKSFKATTAAGLSAQWGKWKALDIGGPAGAVVAADPKNADLVAYHDTFTAWAGKDARALGDEVGTMTDADRLVWKDTFPKPTDTPAIQNQKRKIFNRMIDLIYDINARVATGEDRDAVLNDPKVVDKKNGIFGSAKALGPKSEPKEEVRSLAEEPASAEASTTRGESLLDTMRKEAARELKKSKGK